MLRAAVVFSLGAFSILTAQAHHSDAVYDRDAIVAFEATVLRFQFSNPHVMIFIEAEDERGQPAQWAIETGSTPIMLRSGWSRDLLVAGDTVSIRAHPMRSGEHEAILNTLQTSDGRTWYQVEEAPEVTVAATSLTGVWRGQPRGGPGRQAPLALTPAGEAAMNAYDPVTDSPNAQCIAMPPPFLNASLNYLTGIEILDDRVMLRNEFFDTERTVWLDGRQHPENGERTNHGHSIGHWEGDTLVVDTTLFADHRAPISGQQGNEGVPASSRAVEPVKDQDCQPWRRKRRPAASGPLQRRPSTTDSRLWVAT